MYYMPASHFVYRVRGGHFVLQQTKCFLEADGDILLNSLQGHDAARGYHSTFHKGLCGTPMPIAQAMHTPMAEAAVDKEWDTAQQVACVERF